MRKIIAVLLAISMAIALVGCASGGESEPTATPEATATAEPTAKPTEEPTAEPTAEVATPEPEEESEPIDEIPEIDWDKLVDDFKADASVSSEDFYKDVFVKCDGEMITISAVVAAATEDAVVLEYADTLLRRLGALANQQNNDFATPDMSSFGGIYDYYSVMIGIAPQGSEGDQNDWYIFDAIAKGVQTKHTLKITRK